MKKLLQFTLLFVLVLFVSLSTIFTSASTYELQKANGSGPVVYRGTGVAVEMPTEYIKPDTDFRAVWVSPIVGELNTYSSEATFKNEMNQMFSVLEYYNINVLIFHVRTHNDAYYKSDLNPVASRFASVNFDVFDPLEWLISESHRRGIEFHAWMNPYRLSSSVPSNTLNPASDPSNVLIDPTNSARRILNPGLPNVRDFLVDTVLEFLDRYDADAIHFDDYFYTNLGTNGGNIVAEPDQDTYLTYKPSHYSPTSNTDKANWRREQVDLFIEGLSDAITTFNQETNRYVQFGISPTGIWKNRSYVAAEGGAANYDASGNLITTGSNTAGQEHYASYLFADSKRWVNEEWVDYILPQTYWAFEHPAAGYADVLDWWAKVVRHKDVNLYSGMGIYMALTSSTYSWYSNPMEAPNQIQYASKLPEVQGHSVFSFKHLRMGMNETGGNTQIYTGLDVIRDTMWNEKALRPVIRTMEGANLSGPLFANLTRETALSTLQWSKVEGARGYVIYRATGAIDPNNKAHLHDITGFTSDATMEYLDVNPDTAYNYAVAPIDGTGRIGAVKTFSSEGTSVDQEAIVATQALIDQIPSSFSVTLEDKPLVEEARNKYDLLNETEKTFISNASRITNAETRIAYLEEQQEVAQSVIALIDALPESTALSLDDKDQVVQARTAYDSLNSTQKGLITNLSDLEALEEKLVELEDAKARIDAVIALIEALPEIDAITLDDEATIVAAQDAYDALSTAEQEQVTNYEDLEASQSKLSELKNPDAPNTTEEPENPLERFGCSSISAALFAMLSLGLLIVFKRRKI